MYLLLHRNWKRSFDSIVLIYGHYAIITYSKKLLDIIALLKLAVHYAKNQYTCSFCAMIAYYFFVLIIYVSVNNFSVMSEYNY